MRRRAFIALQLRRQQPDDLADRLADHLDALNGFARPFYGCGKDDLTTESCKPHLARIDRRAYEKARETAKRLFHLKD